VDGRYLLSVMSWNRAARWTTRRSGEEGEGSERARSSAVLLTRSTWNLGERWVTAQGQAREVGVTDASSSQLTQSWEESYLAMCSFTIDSASSINPILPRAETRSSSVVEPEAILGSLELLRSCAKLKFYPSVKEGK
jgi:hypothetical protein